MGETEPKSAVSKLEVAVHGHLVELAQGVSSVVIGLCLCLEYCHFLEEQNSILRRFKVY